MAKVKVKLLRPLNGQEIGATVEYDEADAKRLAEMGAVKILAATKAAPENKGAPANKKAPAPSNKAG